MLIDKDTGMMVKCVIRVISVAFFIALTSCNRQEVVLSEDELRRQDSLALHVAVLPVEACLPLYLAESIGLADSLGLDLRLIRCESLMDIDTAYFNRHIEVAWEDRLRVEQYSRQSPGFLHRDSINGTDTMWLHTPTHLYLLASRQSKIKRLSQLTEKMIAVTRWSAVDSFCNIAIDSAHINQYDVYRPQVNSLKLRMRMLRENLVECAVLPEPYATWAKKEKHRVLFSTEHAADSSALAQLEYATGFFSTRQTLADSLRRKQTEQLRKVYIRAKEILDREGIQILDSLNIFTL